ncbi:MAG: pyridoxal phosphate-dependent aminotransferase [Chlorobi bacterium]|nr:pyridoxal phosphate-dependent aminotransferase [Chlorobiota bacterium]
MKKYILSKRVLNMTVSATLKMTEMSRELKAKGIDIIALSIGEPDFNTPLNVKNAAKAAIDDNLTHYPPVPGLPLLREAISNKLKRDNNLDYLPSQIVVSTGAKHSLANVFMSILDEGDEVVVPSPFWVSYPEMIKLAGGKMVNVDTGIAEGFKLNPQQLEDAITKNTKAFLFNSPSNPTGAVYTYDELKGLAKVLEKHPDILIIADEIYELINFEGKHHSFASFGSLKDRVILINGVSKGFAMTGWRIGYMAAPLEIAKACTKLQGQFTSGASSISQAAAAEAVNTDPGTSGELKTMLKEFRKRRDLLIELMKQIPGIKTNVPGGAFYLFPDISYYFGKTDGKTIIEDSNDICIYLLENAHVALVAGAAFGSPECIRISYATSTGNLKEAVKRISNSLAALK